MIVLVYLEMFQTICRIKKVAKEEGEIKNNKEFPDLLKIIVINYRILKILLNFFLVKSSVYREPEARDKYRY